MDKEEPIGKITTLLEELVILFKIVNKPTIAQRLQEELTDPKRKKIYELSNGNRSSREIAQIVGGINYRTIITYWRRRAQRGIMLPAQRVGRYKHVVDLKEYGMESTETEDE